jgi:hypothetical protein
MRLIGGPFDGEIYSVDCAFKQLNVPLPSPILIGQHEFALEDAVSSGVVYAIYRWDTPTQRSLVYDCTNTKTCSCGRPERLVPHWKAHFYITHLLSSWKPLNGYEDDLVFRETILNGILRGIGKLPPDIDSLLGGATLR